MTARLPLLVALSTAALLAAAAAAGGAAPPRPHADFALRDAGVRVARFAVSARPRADRVLVSVTLTARSRAKTLRTVLRVGRCTGGPPTFPSCEPEVSRVVVLHPRTTTIVHLNARVLRPSARTNAVRVSLTPPGEIVRPSTSPFAGIVDMLLPASAWTTFPARAFGLRIARPWEGEGLPYDVTSITARSAQEDHDHLRATLSWTAALPAGTPVTTSAGARTWQTVANQIGRAGFGERPDLARTTARQVLTVGARTPSAAVFDLVMPWPR